MPDKKKDNNYNETDIALLYERYSNIEEKLTNIERALLGNGNRGLKSRVDMMWGGLILVYVLLISLTGVLALGVGG